MSGEFEPVYSGNLMDAGHMADVLEKAGIETRWIETGGDSLGSSVGYSSGEEQIVLSVPVTQADLARELVRRNTRAE